MKKLESLNSSLFEKFEGKKINNLALCMGGVPVATNGGKDWYNTACFDGHTIYINGVGYPCDYGQNSGSAPGNPGGAGGGQFGG